MVFSSLFFLYVFLPLCLIATALSSKIRTKNIILLVFSLFFYAWGEPLYVFLMMGTALGIWVASNMMCQARTHKQRRFWLGVAVTVPLFFLVFFKYTGFLLDIISYIPGVNLPQPHIVMPIGISFYTFQALTYAIDLYRGKIKRQKSYFRFLLYVSLFPQLIAGPIVRYATIEKELMHREVTFDSIISGIFRFVRGLAKKVLIANYAGEIVEQTLNSSSFSQAASGTALLGILAYTLQIYFDFSAYSDMAIGLGRMFGFHFEENFNYPYRADTITDFWRRWHISLSTFFRDYVYIPLGGNRKLRLRNTFIVWFLTGMWHGASWNFILWGLYYFGLLMLERKFVLPRKDKIPAALRHITTMILVMLGWVLFYFTEFKDIGVFFGRLFAPGEAGFLNYEAKIFWQQNLIFIIGAFVLAMPVWPWLQKFVHRNLDIRRFKASKAYGIMSAVWVTVIMYMCTSTLAASSFNPFLYFRF